MKPRRTFIPIGLAALAAIAAGAMVAAQTSPEDEPDERIAGWEIMETMGYGVSMSHQVGINRIRYSESAPVEAEAARFLLETHPDGENCVNGAPLPAGGNPPPVERIGQIRAQLERKMVEIDPRCVLSPAQNAALLEGFDAAYPALARRIAALQVEAERVMAEQANLAAEMGGADMNAAEPRTPHVRPPRPPHSGAR